MNKPKVFVIRQPKTTDLVIYEIRDIPKKETHETIEALRKVVDIVFVFRNKDGINRKKFAKLYDACAWVDLRDYDCYSYGIVQILDYCISVFQDRHAFLLTNSLQNPDLSKLDTNLETLKVYNIGFPIFEKKRLEYEQIKDIYMDKIPGDNMYTSHYSAGDIYMKSPVVNFLLKLPQEFFRSFNKGVYDNYEYTIPSGISWLGLEVHNDNIYKIEL